MDGSAGARCTARHSSTRWPAVVAVGAHVCRAQTDDEAVPDVGRLRHRAALVAGETDGEEPTRRGVGERHGEVARVAARGHTERDVVRGRVRGELSREDELEADVVREAVSTALSSTRQRARSAGEPSGGRANRAATDAASVLLPPFPNVKSAPPRSNRRAISRPARSTESRSRSRVAVRSAAPTFDLARAESARSSSSDPASRSSPSMNGYRKSVPSLILLRSRR